MPAPLVGVAVKAGVSLLQTPKGRAILAGALVVAVAIPFAAILILAALAGSFASFGSTGNEATYKTKCVDVAPVLGEGAGSTYDTLSDEQRDIATTILGVAKSAKFLDEDNDELDLVQQHAAMVAVMTAMQESSMKNIDYGDRDSVGVFQQRTVVGWGTIEQIMDPVYSASAFFYGVRTKGIPGLLDINDWVELDKGAAAQAVQVSAFPMAYKKWEPLATDVVSNMWSSAAPIPIHPDLERSDTDDVSTGYPAAGPAVCAANSGADWTAPVDGSGTIGAWGGYDNGLIPTSVLVSPTWAPNQHLHPSAAAALEELNEAYKTKFGSNISITDSYRTLGGQVTIRASWCARGACHMAATPGKSNHGWALALDLGGGINSWRTPQQTWMYQHAREYGWVNPDWAQPGKGQEEPWHYEYMGELDES